MQIPFSAIWPPVALLIAAIAATIVTWLIGWWPITAIGVPGSAILAFDIRGRMIDYRHAHRHFSLGRDPVRVAKNYQMSWCGRVACEKAAVSAGAEPGDAVKKYYRDSGYRWFHIFPDNTFSLQSPFLSLRFWEVTLLGNNRARQKLEEEAATSEPIVLQTRRGETGNRDVKQAA